MKKGIFSSMIAIITLFLIAATIIYAQIPIQEIKTTSQVEGIKNFNFSAQIARDFADKTLSEAIYDEVDKQNDCHVRLNQTELNNRFNQYASNPLASFDLCEIKNPLILSVSPDVLTGTTGEVHATAKIECRSPQTGSAKLFYSKTFSFYKKFEANQPPPAQTGQCSIIIRDADAQDSIDISGIN